VLRRDRKKEDREKSERSQTDGGSKVEEEECEGYDGRVMDGWVDGRVDGWMGGWDRYIWIDRWMD